MAEKGRLPRESNPIFGEEPGFVASHDTTGDEDYERTSPKNPLPTKNSALEDKLNDIEKKLDSVIENGVINTQLSGSNVEDGIVTKNKKKVVIDEIIDSETLGAGQWTKQQPIGFTDEDDIWFMINIDKQPWSLNTTPFGYSVLRSVSTPKGYGVFPPKGDVTKTYTNNTYRSTSLWMGGVYLHDAYGLKMPETLADAFASRSGYFPEAEFAIENRSSEDATISVKIVRVWR